MQTKTLICSALILLFLGGPASAQSTPDGTLKGVVLGPDGKGLGGAEVTIQAVFAKRLGDWVNLPSYEIEKRTVTSDDGRFEFGGMKGEAYDLSVIADGFRSAWISHATPGNPIEAKLDSANSNLSPLQRIRIRVVDENERPIAAARMRVEAVYDLRSRNRPGDTELVEQSGVSDAQGEIELRTTIPMVGVGGWVSARGFVSELVSAYAVGVPGREGFEMSDERGAYSRVELVTGHAAIGSVWNKPDGPADGKPLAGAVVEIIRVTSNPRHVDRTRVLTSDDGRFELPRVSAFMSLRVCGILGQTGSTPMLDVNVSPESLEQESPVDIGVLMSRPGFTLSGQLVLEGAIPPAGTQLRLRRSRGWDYIDTTTDPEGRFTFSAIPPGTSIEITLLSTGLILAGDQPGFDVTSNGIVGLVDDSISGVTIALHRGKRPSLGILPREIVAELRLRREELETIPLGKPHTTPKTP